MAAVSPQSISEALSTIMLSMVAPSEVLSTSSGIVLRGNHVTVGKNGVNVVQTKRHKIHPASGHHAPHMPQQQV